MFILLLGSYDHETKRLLYSIQSRIAEYFVEDGCYSLLMEKLDLYRVSDRRQVIVERNEGENLTFYIFSQDVGATPPMLEMIDTVAWHHNSEKALYSYLIDQYMSTPEIRLEKTPISTETGLFSFLVSISELYFIIRLKEETRGGEYLELCQITKAQNRTWIEAAPNIYLFKKDDITLSTMLDLILNEGGLVHSEFTDSINLENSLVSVIKSRLG